MYTQQPRTKPFWDDEPTRMRSPHWTDAYRYPVPQTPVSATVTPAPESPVPAAPETTQDTTTEARKRMLEAQKLITGARLTEALNECNKQRNKEWDDVRKWFTEVAQPKIVEVTKEEPGKLATPTPVDFTFQTKTWRTNKDDLERIKTIGAVSRALVLGATAERPADIDTAAWSIYLTTVRSLQRAVLTLATGEMHKATRAVWDGDATAKMVPDWFGVCEAEKTKRPTTADASTQTDASDTADAKEKEVKEQKSEVSTPTSAPTATATATLKARPTFPPPHTLDDETDDMPLPLRKIGRTGV